MSRRVKFSSRYKATAWEQREFADSASRVSLMGDGEPDLPCVEYEDIV